MTRLSHIHVYIFDIYGDGQKKMKDLPQSETANPMVKIDRTSSFSMNEKKKFAVGQVHRLSGILS